MHMISKNYLKLVYLSKQDKQNQWYNPNSPSILFMKLSLAEIKSSVSTTLGKDPPRDIQCSNASENRSQTRTGPNHFTPAANSQPGCRQEGS